MGVQLSDSLHPKILRRWDLFENGLTMGASTLV